MARIHGAAQHAGRAYADAPELKLSKAETARRLAELREALKEAVAREDFEAAARLRDELKRLEGRHG